MEFNPDAWFGPARPMTCGVECEVIIYDAETASPLRAENLHKALHCYEQLPDNIWKDYYAHQCEIRTDPFDNPGDVIKQLKELYQKASQVFEKQNLYLIPVPWAASGEQSYCGMHVHIRYKDEQVNKQYYPLTWNALPFILAIADVTKNSESDWLNNSARIRGSNHIGLPHVDEKLFWNGRGQYRYKDITVNRQSKTDEANPKTRLKTIETLETRIYDTPSLEEHMKFIIEGTYGVFSRIRADGPITQRGISKSMNKLIDTRVMAINQRKGFNTVLGMANQNVAEYIGAVCGINVPTEAQYEFRERILELTPVEKKLAMRAVSWGMSK